MEIRIELTTLLGWDDHPAYVAGWDHIHAPLARRMAYSQSRGEWRFAITDRDGRLLTAPTGQRPAEGITSARPTGWREHTPSCPGGILELAIPLHLLQELATDPTQAGNWAPVITDIATQTSGPQPPTSCSHDSQDQDNQRPPAQDDPPNPASRPGEDDPAKSQTAPRERDTQRFPRTGLRRHTQIRDRQCAAPGCRAPAMACQTDHIIRHTDGGPTTAANLQNLCAHDHAMKDNGGWKASRLANGTTKWTTPHGTTHYVDPPRIITDLPPPHPRD